MMQHRKVDRQKQAEIYTYKESTVSGLVLELEICPKIDARQKHVSKQFLKTKAFIFL